MTAEGDLVLGLDERQVVLFSVAVVVVVDVHLGRENRTIRTIRTSLWRNIRKLYSRNLDYALMKECDNYRLRGECALVRLGEVGGAELVLADDDAVA